MYLSEKENFARQQPERERNPFPERVSPKLGRTAAATQHSVRVRAHPRSAQVGRLATDPPIATRAALCLARCHATTRRAAERAVRGSCSEWSGSSLVDSVSGPWRPQLREDLHRKRLVEACESFRRGLEPTAADRAAAPSARARGMQTTDPPAHRPTGTAATMRGLRWTRRRLRDTGAATDMTAARRSAAARRDGLRDK